MVIEYYAEIYPERIRKIAAAMGVALPVNANNVDVAEITANALRALRAKLNLPKFSEFGFGYDALPELSQMCLTDPAVFVLRMSVPGREITAQDFLVPMQKEYNRE